MKIVRNYDFIVDISNTSEANQSHATHCAEIMVTFQSLRDSEAFLALANRQLRVKNYSVP